MIDRRNRRCEPIVLFAFSFPLSKRYALFIYIYTRQPHFPGNRIIVSSQSWSKHASSFRPWIRIASTIQHASMPCVEPSSIRLSKEYHVYPWNGTTFFHRPPTRSNPYSATVVNTLSACHANAASNL